MSTTAPRRRPHRAFTADDLWRVERLGPVALAPCGSQAVCSVTRWSMAENQARTQLWRMPTGGPSAGRAHPLTHGGEKDGQPAYAPDGRQIAFVGQREQEGHKDESPQLYLMAADGGEARRASRFGPGVLAFRWHPDSRHIVFVAWVWPELRGMAAQERQHRAWRERKESGYATSRVQYRYWDRNLPQDRVAQLLMLDTHSGRIRNLFEGSGHELPRDEPGLEHFDLSPDGRHLVFVHDPAPEKAGGNRCELVELRLAPPRRGSASRRFTTVAGHADWDFSAPRYAPDGERLAAVATPIGRSRWAFGQLAVWPRSRGFEPVDACDWTLDVQGPLHWEPAGQALWLAAEAQGRRHAFRHALATRQFERRIEGGWVHTLAVAGSAEAPVVACTRDRIDHPVQLLALAHGATQPRRLESFNDSLMRSRTLGRVEEVQLEGALGEPVQMWVTYPPGFSARRKHPALHVIHGGPYTAAGDSFGLRWNAHVLASQGHVVVQVNYHGSSGFGEGFRASIMGRQGELELADILAGTRWLQARPWFDASRLYASGASYGGFLVAWMNGRLRPWPEGPVRAAICHAGVFDRVATWSADSYMQRWRDLHGTYWEAPARVAAQNPRESAAHMDTPTLVIHGALDYRVPDHNGLAFYNTLKARGVDARLLWFPDENHWVLKARNSRQWHAEFFGWLRRHG